MKITRRSRISGKVHTRDLPVTQEQLDAFNRGVFIQDAMPGLPAHEREFILTGTTPEEWVAVFPEKEG